MLACFLYPGVTAQDISIPVAPAFQILTTENGLPSNEVYQVVQDKRDYLWFATDRGVARYNGYDFKTYGITEGLEGIVVFGFAFDRFDRLWCYNYQREIYYLENDTFHRHPVSDHLQMIKHKIHDLFWQEDTLWIMSQNKLIKMYPDGRVEELPHLSNDENMISVYQVNDTSYASMLHNHPHKAKGFVLKSEKKIWKKKFPSPPDCGPRSSFFTLGRTSQKGFMSYGSCLISWNPDTFQMHTFSYRLNHALYVDKKDLLWVGTDNGVYLFNAQNITEPLSILLPQQDVTSILCDREGGYWFTSERSGVFYLAGTAVRSLPIEGYGADSRVFSVELHDDTLFYNSFDGNLYKAYLPAGKKKLLARAMPKWKLGLIDNERVALIGTNVYERSWIATQPKHPSWDYRYRPDSLIYGHNILVFQKKDSILFVAEKDTFCIPAIRRSFPHRWATKDYIFTGDIFGLMVIDRHSGQLLDSLPEIFNTRITGITGFTGNDSIHILATAGMGVMVCKGLEVINHIRTGEGLPDNLCNDIFMADDDRLWVSTNKGLSRIEHAAETNSYKISNYSTSDGLPSRQIYTCVVRNGWIAVGTPFGVAYFQKDQYQEHPPDFPVYLTGIEINRESSHTLKVNSLSYFQNDILLSYEAVTFKYAEELMFRYRLIGLDSNWRNTTDFSIQYNNLSPGEYCFQLQGGTLYDGWSDQTTTFSFRITPPFWTTWWFLFLITFLLISSIIWIFRWRISVLNRRQRIENRLFFYRQQAMGLQMNPHFLFNSIGSIQAHILDQDQKSLLRHLASFAKLIRMIFNISRKNLVSLADELTLLNQYLDFEKLRFKEKLNYHFDIDPLMEKEQILVPPLLIQPIVENAIKHGRDVIKGKVTINIRIHLFDRSLIFEVQDSGEGYDGFTESGGNKIGDHVSAGLNLVQRRLDLLSEWLGKPTKFKIKKLQQQDEVSGTLVTVEIPLVKKQKRNDQSSNNR